MVEKYMWKNLKKEIYKIDNVFEDEQQQNLWWYWRKVKNTIYNKIIGPSKCGKTSVVSAS